CLKGRCLSSNSQLTLRQDPRRHRSLGVLSFRSAFRRESQLFRQQRAVLCRAESRFRPEVEVSGSGRAHLASPGQRSYESSTAPESASAQSPSSFPEIQARLSKRLRVHPRSQGSCAEGLTIA